MDAELGQSLFNSARDRFDAMGRWLLLTVLVLLVFHIATLHPFVSASLRLERVQSETASLEQLAPRLDALRQSLDELAAASREQIDATVERLLAAKISDFEELSRTVRVLKGELPPQAEPSDLTVQAALPAPEPASSELPALAPELAERIRAAPPEQIRTLLLDYIEANIIERRFAEANQRLQEAVAPEIVRRSEALRLQASELAAARPQWADAWDSLQAALTRTMQAGETLALNPPADDEWWSSVAAKMETLDELGRELVARLEADRLASVGDSVAAALDAALAQQAGLQAELTSTIAELERQFAEQQKQLQAMGQPFKWVALDLAVAVSRFPLLLALALAALSVAASHRLRELALALSLLPEPKERLWTWYFQRGAGTLGTRGLAAPRAADVGALLAGLPELLVGLGWVAVAAWQVGSGRVPERVDVIGLMLLGWAALALAYGYRQWVLREALRLRRNP